MSKAKTTFYKVRDNDNFYSITPCLFTVSAIKRNGEKHEITQR